ncbi:NAD(P)-dependent alcohol dehydrogenase [Tsuneonella sp. CC-YZS046]|uniref:NAD(P)-dependent alcohol dehydrogenase n=1 Tax=Tsuneonella sp. CC-YZS046 TaxID=3042152 RepID=UPI002D785AB7|nr:NAD(P)-dependent alcohol dehydrogenase [Tsuneonella sp. CC-YZS046]WRO67115.1 NAD(P)-dependent alcohol dehydrogenase [Tsuneonella sp. CC-YZS046]
MHSDVRPQRIAEESAPGDREIAQAFAALAAAAPLSPIEIERRSPRPNDVAIAIAYCGVCHSDLHAARGEWPGMMCPMVPGHEIVGRVTSVGSKVTAFQPGDLVGVGCMVDSCRKCSSCGEGAENYCESEQGYLQTYNGYVKGGDRNTYGGYSTAITVDERFVLAIRHPESQLAAVAPLLCAGVTTWSPLRYWNAGPGRRVGVVGIGGLGHMAVKLARALGAHVVGFTTSESKRDAILALGAHEVVLTSGERGLDGYEQSLDLILDTVGSPHDLDVYLSLLKRDGTLVLVGVPDAPHPSPSAVNLILGRRSIAGSLIGGLKETQEMLDFCAENGIVSEIEQIAIQDIDELFDRMIKGDVKYRFVIDLSTI